MDKIPVDEGLVDAPQALPRRFRKPGFPVDLSEYWPDDYSN